MTDSPPLKRTNKLHFERDRDAIGAALKKSFGGRFTEVSAGTWGRLHWIGPRPIKILVRSAPANERSVQVSVQFGSPIGRPTLAYNLLAIVPGTLMVAFAVGMQWESGTRVTSLNLGLLVAILFGLPLIPMLRRLYPLSAWRANKLAWKVFDALEELENRPIDQSYRDSEVRVGAEAHATPIEIENESAHPTRSKKSRP